VRFRSGVAFLQCVIVVPKLTSVIHNTRISVIKPSKEASIREERKIGTTYQTNVESDVATTARWAVDHIAAAHLKCVGSGVCGLCATSSYIKSKVLVVKPEVICCLW
jgi:hypothetical protein